MNTTVVTSQMRTTVMSNRRTRKPVTFLGRVGQRAVRPLRGGSQMPVGFRVIRRSSRPESALLKRFAPLHTADLSDAMNRSGTMDRGIQPAFSPIQRVVGAAVTVSAPTGAFNIVKIGMEQTQAGDVLVINARGVINGALVGGNVCRGLLHRGLAGLVADGAVRDAGEIQQDGLPTFARGRSEERRVGKEC